MTKTQKLEVILAVIGVIIATIALIPAFGQWLFPREPLPSSTATGSIVLPTLTSTPLILTPTSAVEMTQILPTPNDSILFQDTFSQSSLGNEWQIAIGNWYIKDGVLNGIGDSEKWAFVTLIRELPTNYEVSFRTQIIDGPVSELMLHVSDNRYIRIYLFLILTELRAVFGDGYIRSDYSLGGPSLANTAVAVTQNTWYDIKATARNGIYTVSVNNQQLIYYIDEETKLSPRGTIGLVSTGHMQFDDVVVTK